jgi:hypothetical protein
MATAALVIGAIGTVSSVIQQRKAGKEQRRQSQIQNRIAATRRVRSIKRNIAASRIRRAEAQSAGFEFGVAGGTAAQGAEFGITGDLASSIGASNQQFTGQQAVVASQNRVSSLQQSAATFGGIANLAGQFDEQAVASITSLV